MKKILSLILSVVKLVLMQKRGQFPRAIVLSLSNFLLSKIE